MLTAATNAIATTSGPPPSCRPTPAHITPQPEGRRPPRQDVARGDDPGEPGARLLEVAVAVQHVADQVVDQGEVLVVDVALLDLADQHDAGSSGSGW